MFCGSPTQVADQMEEWFTAPACDGFVLAAALMAHRSFPPIDRGLRA